MTEQPIKQRRRFNFDKLVPIDLNKLSGKLKILYRNYSFSTYKFRRLYYSDQDYRAIADYLVSIVPLELTRREMNRVIPVLEQIECGALRILCDMARSGDLDRLCALLNNAVKNA